jgi:HNH endonuclease
MFDPGITNLIGGQDIDRPYNALTLTHDLHQRFGSLEVYFELPHTENVPQKNTYIIRSTESYPWQRNPRFPLVRTLLTSPNKTIDPPSPRLLSIHRACALILHCSGAGYYIEKILRDGESLMAETDGSTELGSVIWMKMWGNAVAVP